ncbi:MAG: secondary thiamine-phosphate synthase enzyme YjbQ [Chloroflexi bacterium]|nr:secondary thiamine-phosphate synthase enzyme YjbQ [Chloroflexota bacterium]MBU1750158.1 secondary thiamine-phosphate synthase enzyme YjbQ [Chloroflexota bacterium]
MIHQITLRTGSQTTLDSITAEVQRVIRESGVQNGVCHIFVPHTTAGVTINEDADPTVKRDMLHELNKVIPFQDGYHHAEGNAAAHIKSTLVGPSLTVLVENGRLVLGTWQGIFFCEFDGPRQRRVLVKVVPDPA